jgi:hypothetical protein
MKSLTLSFVAFLFMYSPAQAWPKKKTENPLYREHITSLPIGTRVTLTRSMIMMPNKTWATFSSSCRLLAREELRNPRGLQIEAPIILNVTNVRYPSALDQLRSSRVFERPGYYIDATVADRPYIQGVFCIPDGIGKTLGGFVAEVTRAKGAVVFPAMDYH